MMRLSFASLLTPCLYICLCISQTSMHVTMLRLSFAYAIFTAPRVVPHLLNSRLKMTPSQSMALYSWYCWMYAINVIIYVVSSSEFRKVYKMFFEDVFAGFAILWRKTCFLRKSDTSTPAIELYSVKNPAFVA